MKADEMGKTVISSDAYFEWDEDRYLTIGRMDCFSIILVVSTERGFRTRIISARSADKDEMRFYYEKQRN